LQPRWRGRARRELSPLSAALQRANKQMPPMWDPIPLESGSRRDRKVAAAVASAQSSCYFAREDLSSNGGRSSRKLLKEPL
jgi:hypothetical protein